jgi:hypothetical protein
METVNAAQVDKEILRQLAWVIAACPSSISPHDRTNRSKKMAWLLFTMASFIITANWLPI